MAETEVKSKDQPPAKAPSKAPAVEVILPSVVVRTADDAVQAYLQDLIDEGQLRSVLAANGITTLYKPNNERPDAAYERKLPDDLFEPPSTPYDDYEYRKGLQDAKDKERADALEKTKGETREETIARETAALTEKNDKRS